MDETSRQMSVTKNYCLQNCTASYLAGRSHVPGMRRHCCISDRRASNDTRSAFARTRQAGARGAMILSTVGR